MPSDPRTLRTAASLAVFALVATLGIATMGRTVGLVDHGELLAVATTLGIAHPTGYPTFTLLGHLATRLLPMPPLLALNLLAALLVAAGAALLVPLYEETLAAAGAAPRPAGPAPPPDADRPIAAAFAALATALTATWWQQATNWEVYALHALFLPLVTLLFLRWVRWGTGGWKFALALGLSFTNHLTTILLAPAFLALALARLGARRTFGASLRLAPAFLAGLLPYLYLPLRAAQEPRFSWGDPATLDGFVRHVTGWQYRAWMFSSFDEARQQAAYLLARLPWDLGWLGLVPIALGAVVLARRAPALAAFAALLVAASFAYACGYGIADIDSYVLAGVMGLGIALAHGLWHVRERYGRRTLVLLGAAVAVAGLAAHADSVDQRRVRIADDLARDVLAPLPRRAVLYSGRWDDVVSPSLYLQEVEGFRRDVLVVSPLLLRYDWYVRELARRAPEPMRAAVNEVEAYRRLEVRFERGLALGGEPIAARFDAFTRAFTAACLDAGRPVFVTPEVDLAVPPGLRTVPFHLTQAFSVDTGYVAIPFPRYRHRSWPARVDGHVAAAASLYGLTLVQRAQYEVTHGRPRLAGRYLEYALTFDPGLPTGTRRFEPVGSRAMFEPGASLFARLRATLGRRPAAAR